MANQQRFTVLLDGPTVAVLDEIQAATRLRSRAAVFDLAVNVLDWFIDQRRKGMEVGRFNSNTGKFEELLLPVVLTVDKPPVVNTPDPDVVEIRQVNDSSSQQHEAMLVA